MIYDKLKEFGIEHKLYAAASVMCLPENILTESELYKLIEPSDQIWLVKRLREEGVKVFTLYDAKIDVGNLERRGDERWYGHVVIDKVTIPILVAVLSGTFVLALDRATKDERPSNKVHIDLTVKNEDQETRINFDGNGEILVKILDSLKADEERN